MNHFDYRNGVLHAEAVNLSDLAAGVGTPFYCYSTATLERHYRVFCDAFAGDARDLEERHAAFTREPLQRRDPLGVLRRVHFGGDHDHGLRRQIVGETGQLRQNYFEIMHRIAPGVGNIHQMRQQPRALHMPQELDT